jgi:hypothetical protein
MESYSECLWCMKDNYKSRDPNTWGYPSIISPFYIEDHRLMIRMYDVQPLISTRQQWSIGNSTIVFIVSHRSKFESESEQSCKINYPSEIIWRQNTSFPGPLRICCTITILTVIRRRMLGTSPHSCCQAMIPARILFPGRHKKLLIYVITLTKSRADEATRTASISSNRQRNGCIKKSNPAKL